MIKRKGFTKVELISSLAIMLIIATLSVLGYLAFGQKVDELNEPSDLTLTTQINKALEESEKQNKKASTMSEALSIINKVGIDIEKVQSNSKGSYFAFDSESGRMFLMNGAKEILAPSSFKDKNSHDTFVIVSDDNDLKIWSEYAWYLASNYEGTNEFNTLHSIDVSHNLENLSINSEENGEIVISGNIENLDINLPNASVNFYGDVTTANVKTNTIGLTTYGHIQQLNIKSGCVTVNQDSLINTIDASTPSGNIILDSDKGIIGAVVLDKNNSSNVTIKSNISQNLIVDQLDVVAGFAGGTGKENSPYLINNETNFKLIESLSLKMTTTKYYFKQINNFSVELESSFIQENLNLNYNGNNKIITIINKSDNKKALFENVSNAYFSNLIINLENVIDFVLVDKANQISFDNVLVKGIINFTSNFTNSSLYCSLVDEKVVFSNCIVEADIKTTTNSSVFVGSTVENVEYSFSNCTFNGNIMGDYVSILFANIVNTNLNLKLTNVTNNGLVAGYERANLISSLETSQDLKQFEEMFINNGQCILIKR